MAKKQFLGLQSLKKFGDALEKVAKKFGDA